MFSSRSAPAPPHGPDAAAGDAPAIPRDSSPTWELEMLVSGAVLFSLFQLPPQLDDALARWSPHTTRGVGFALLLCYAYLKGALYTLIAGFVVHLCVRAYWVGVVGLNSVYPGGARFERAMMGPITRSVYRERMLTLPALIARLDNFASVIFSFAFLIVLVILVTIVLLVVGGLLTYLASRLFGPVHPGWIAALITLVFVVFPSVVATIDLNRGARLQAEGRDGGIRRLTTFVYRLSLVGLIGPVLYTLTTNTRRRAMSALFYVAVFAACVLGMSDWIAGRGIVTASGADYFATRSDANAVHYGHYESAWDEEVLNDAAPSIQSDVVRDPYLKLFIPYQPPRHNPGVAALCPGVRPLQQRGVRFVGRNPARPADADVERVLQCLARMHDVRIDGAPPSALRFRFASHARTGVDGIVAYIPVTALPAGEHVLTVMPPPRRPGSRVRRPLEAYVIPFWR